MARAALCLLALSLAAPAARAGVADPAELFPADTLAYAEVGRPGELAEALAALFRGTPLADPVRFAHDRLDRAQTPQEAAGAHRAAWVALLTAPELAAEARRLRGVAAGLTGFTPTHRPRFAVAVLLGDSPAAGLAARIFLTTSPDLRRVGDVDGVTVFQPRGFVGRPLDPNGNPIPEEKPKEGGPPPGTPEAPDEPTFAHAPGLFVVGSDKAAVADVLRRHAGKGDGRSLAAAEAFRECAPLRRRPGVFFFANPPALGAKIDLDRNAGGRPIDPDLYALWQFTAPLKRTKVIAGNLALGPGPLTLTAEAKLDPAGAPLPDLLAGPPAPRDGLAFPGGPPGWAVTASLPADRRAKAVLALLDAVAKANGSLGRPPSEAVAEADKGAAPTVAGELLPAVKAVTVFTPAKAELPAGARPLPVLVLRLETAADAAKWEAAAPRLLRLLAGTDEPLTPSSEVVARVRVVSVAGKGLPGSAPLHFARVGELAALGQDRRLVAEAAAGKGTAVAWPADFGQEAAGLAVVTPARLVAHLIPPKKGPETVRGPQPPFLAPGGAPPGPPEPLAVGLARSVGALPPVFAAATRTRDALRLELRLPEPGKPVAAAVERFIGWLEKQPTQPPNPYGGYLPGLIDR